VRCKFSAYFGQRALNKVVDKVGQRERYGERNDCVYPARRHGFGVVRNSFDDCEVDKLERKRNCSHEPYQREVLDGEDRSFPIRNRGDEHGRERNSLHGIAKGLAEKIGAEQE
jgi:hypothetical protein